MINYHYEFAMIDATGEVVLAEPGDHYRVTDTKITVGEPDPDTGSVNVLVEFTVVEL